MQHWIPKEFELLPSKFCETCAREYVKDVATGSGEKYCSIECIPIVDAMTINRYEAGIIKYQEQ